MSEENTKLRIDKWLWFARVAKTRSLAAKLVVAGNVRVNKEKASAASRSVKPGDVLTIAKDNHVRILEIVALGTRRGPAPEAQQLYKDLTPRCQRSLMRRCRLASFTRHTRGGRQSGIVAS